MDIVTIQNTDDNDVYCAECKNFEDSNLFMVRMRFMTLILCDRCCEELRNLLGHREKCFDQYKYPCSECEIEEDTEECDICDYLGIDKALTEITKKYIVDRPLIADEFGPKIRREKEYFDIDDYKVEECENKEYCIDRPEAVKKCLRRIEADEKELEKFRTKR